MSVTEYSGIDAKLEVLSTEQSAVNTGRQVKRAEQSALSKERQASGTEQSVAVRDSGVGNGAIRERHTGAKCQSTERSVDRHGGPSVERGAIRGRRRVQGVERGAIRERRRAPGIEYGAIRKRCGVLSAEHGVIRAAGRPANSTGAVSRVRSNP